LLGRPVRVAMRISAFAWLAATATALRAPASALRLRSARQAPPRTTNLLAQNREEILRSVKTAGSQATYYYNEQAHAQWAHQATNAPQDRAQVLWRVTAFSGVSGFNFFQDEELVYIPLPYALRAGEEQVLSRWNMLKQKLHVSRVQCVVQVRADGTGVVESRGKGPTLWRERGGAWYALQKGETAPLADGDQVSVDCNDPEAAVFTVHDERPTQHESSPQREQPEFPYPWEQLLDQNGAVYYYNPQSGETSWDPPQQDGCAQQTQTELPYPWEQLLDQNGAVYYCNPQSGETSWDPPQHGSC